ncbi:hypothetical protein KI387_029949, partial [Taxus chinensis]
PTPQDKGVEVISIFEEYNILPQYVKENFHFKDYMDMHPNLGHKIEHARKEYHTIASDFLIHGRNSESSHMVDTTLHESALVSSSSNEVHTNLYYEFDRHVDSTQEDMGTTLGNDLLTSSFQKVSLEASTLEASIEHVSVLDNNGMDSLGDHKEYYNMIVKSNNVTSSTHEEKSNYSSQGYLEQKPMIWEEVDDYNDNMEEDPKNMIWCSINLSSHSHEIIALTHGEKNEEESTNVGN